jgi:hypothetical protein
LFSRKEAAPTSSPPAQDFISGSIRVLRRARAQAQFSCEFPALCFEGHIFLLNESKKLTTDLNNIHDMSFNIIFDGDIFLSVTGLAWATSLTRA